MIDFIELKKLNAKMRDKLKDSDFGIYETEPRMYPLIDKTHVTDAIRLFSNAPAKYKKVLAQRILAKAKKFGIEVKSEAIYKAAGIKPKAKK